MTRERQVQDAIARRLYVGIKRSIPGSSDGCGFILGASREWLLLHVISEFHLDGYHVIRFQDVEEIWNPASHRYFEKILKAVGVYQKVGLNVEIDLTTIQTILASLKKIGRNIIIEGEILKPETFIIGKIVRVGKRSVAFLDFGPDGKWEAKSELFPYSKITSVSFDTEYINVFSKCTR
jgi:hypothetical protein